LNITTAPYKPENIQSRTLRHKLLRSQKGPIPPSRIAAVIALYVLVSETAIMFLLESLHPLPIPWPALLDSSILLACLAVFYVAYFRPFWDEHQQFALEVSHLSRRLMSSAEDERKRLTQDLHDQCGQTLTALQLRIDALRKTIPQTHKQQHHQLLEITGLLSRLGSEFRDVTHSLQTVTLDKVGLVSALRSLLGEFASLHPQIEVVENFQLTDELLPGLDEHGALALFRICQEGLNNIHKHAEASRVEISLGQCSAFVTLVVEDNGKGFTQRRIHGGRRKGHLGIGLLGMRERVSELKGALDVASALGTGTRITVQLPLTRGENHG